MTVRAPHPSARVLERVAACLAKGSLLAYPTDSLYAVGCDPSQSKAFEKLCAIKGFKPKTAMLSYLCSDLAQASKLVRQLDKELFRFISRNSPGAATFILPAAKDIPHYLKNNRKTIGIRIPDHYFTAEMLKYFDGPIVTASLAQDEMEEMLFPDELVQKYEQYIDLWIDDERGQAYPSTIVDCTIWPPELVRQGGLDLSF